MKMLVDRILKKKLGGKLNFIRSHNKRLRTLGRYIEFVGPSGIGKSTILNEVKNNTMGDWYFIEDLPQIQLKCASDGISELAHWKLLYAKFKFLDKYELNAYQKIRLVKYFSDIIANDLVIYNGITEKGFLLEEGICNNFAKELTELPIIDFQALMAGRALVLMVAQDSMIVVNQIRKRESESQNLSPYHQGLNNKELKEITEMSAKLFDTLVQKAVAIGIPVCKIIAEDGYAFNVRRILDFEQQQILFDQIHR